jgi:methylenetetrahydrofolate--tRNA-(uracil-5-)-methyltransferase
MERLMKNEIVVVGGGLAGSEAAWQAARLGCRVCLWEMRPAVLTPAHRGGDLAELVCSNSFGSVLIDRPLGLLKAELERLGSLIVACAKATAVPAGSALAVDRDLFAAEVTRRIQENGSIDLRREEVDELPEGVPVVVASGPLTSDALAAAIRRLTGQEYLHFFDAMAPIVTLESIDMGRTFRGGRYGRGNSDYINCPLSEAEYARFATELAAAETIPLRAFEAADERFFEACLPIEVLARRGRQAMAYGPLRPVGLIDPRTGRQPYAVVQLRQDNLAGTLYNMVGFQTNLRWSEQKRVFSLIPGLERAEFVRFGQMHRNTFLAAPAVLEPTMQYRGRADLYFAGQITGTEGYAGSAMSGLVAGLNAARSCRGEEPLTFPTTTMTGALCHYVARSEARGFQPMKANFGLLPELETPSRRKRARHQAMAERALAALEQFCRSVTEVS